MSAKMVCGGRRRPRAFSPNETGDLSGKDYFWAMLFLLVAIGLTIFCGTGCEPGMPFVSESFNEKDADGDGVPDEFDNCPNDANTPSEWRRPNVSCVESEDCLADNGNFRNGTVRPMIGDGEDRYSVSVFCVNGSCALQADSDGDGKGDACDPPKTLPLPVAMCLIVRSDANCDGLDDDCDGTPDDDFVPTATTCGLGACINSGKTFCVDGRVKDNCEPAPAFTVKDDVCDGVDDDCDGFVDDDYVSLQLSCGVDGCRAFGHTVCENGVESAPWDYADECAFLDKDGDGLTPCAGDCDDARAESSPDLQEVCDGVDNNCDGEIDEGCSTCDLNYPLCCEDSDCGENELCWSSHCISSTDVHGDTWSGVSGENGGPGWDGNPDCLDWDGDCYCAGVDTDSDGLVDACCGSVNSHCPWILPGDCDDDPDDSAVLVMACESFNGLAVNYSAASMVCADGSTPLFYTDGSWANNPSVIDILGDNFDNNCDGLVDPEPAVDAGMPDATNPDTSSADAGVEDTGSDPDSAVEDVYSAPDAGVEDTRVAEDATVATDAYTEDATTAPDSTVPDTAFPDTGPECVVDADCGIGKYCGAGFCYVRIDQHGRTGLGQSGVGGGPWSDGTPDDWDNDGDCYCEILPCLGSVNVTCADLGLYGGDCDDTATGQANHPGVPEYSGDNFDNNCDGVIL